MDYLLLLVLPSLFFGGVLRLLRLSDDLRRLSEWRRARRRRAEGLPDVRIPRVPLERLAADLRRLHGEVTGDARDRSQLKRRATAAAYEDLLREACELLEVDPGPDPPGEPATARRRRLADALADAGLRIDGERV